MDNDRRKHDRTDINITTRITYDPVTGSGPREMLGKTRDLSLGGAMVAVSDLSEIKDLHKLEFRIPELSSRVSTEAVVRWTADDNQTDFIGAEFTSLTTDEQNAIEKFLKRNQTQDITQKASPARFEEFLVCLQEEFDVSDRKIKELERTPPDKLYESAAKADLKPYEVAEFIANHLELPYTPTISDKSVDLDDLSESFCNQNHLLPVRKNNGERVLVLSNPYTHVFHSTFKRYFESDVTEYLITEPENIRNVLQDDGDDDAASDPGSTTPAGAFILEPGEEQEFEEAYINDLTISDEYDDIAKVREESEKKDVIRIVNKLLFSAIEEGVSDIHIEPHPRHLLVRYRIDGVLKRKWQLPESLTRVLTTRIKIMSEMDIAERRKPQDGGFRVLYEKQEIDVRASVIPVNTGEKTVLRLLDKGNIPNSLDGLGFDEQSVRLLRESLSYTKGILYFTGPTGSGKTTTMYTCLQNLSSPQLNIQTVEDPIEYNIPEINQMEIHPKAGLTFSRALRGILRQDPDVLMLGEIRDGETLDIAAKAAMSGHLVLSTLHTNDAASTVERLLNIGLDAFSIATTTRIIVAQRLIRTLCPKCKQEVDDPDLYVEMYPVLDVESLELYEPNGCKSCNQTGYRGQTGVMECLPATEPVRKAIRENLGTDEIRKIMTDELGLGTLRENAFQKVAEGKTSAEEALRVSMI